VEQFEHIRRAAHQEGLSVRALARRYRVHRRAVRQALAGVRKLAEVRPEVAKA
jgi:ActR/RegA family two-component response regulator